MVVQDINMKILKWNFCNHDWEFNRYIYGEERRRNFNLLEYKCRKCGKIKNTCCKIHSIKQIR